MQDEPEISDIGAELVGASRDLEKTPGELLGELFPYVYDASRRMSTRAISAWLKENHGLQISQPTISRALRNPEKYWQAFAEFIEPAARRVEEEIRATMQSFLFDERVFEHLLRDLPSSFAFPAGGDEAAQFSEIEEAADFLNRKWFSLQPHARLHCRQYFKDLEASESADETES